MSTIELTRPEHETPTGRDPLCHLAATCCPPYELTLCGQEIEPGQPPADGQGELTCVVCIDIIQTYLRDRAPCPRCGKAIP